MHCFIQYLYFVASPTSASDGHADRTAPAGSYSPRPTPLPSSPVPRLPPSKETITDPALEIDVNVGDVFDPDP